MLGKVKNVVTDKVELCLFYPSEDYPWMYLKPIEDDVIKLPIKQLIAVVEKSVND